MSVGEPLTFLQPHVVDLTRVGRANDGGYVIPTYFLHETRQVVALGVATDWSFERDFVSRASIPCRVVLADRSSGSWTFAINALRELFGFQNRSKSSLKRTKSWIIHAGLFFWQVRRTGWSFYRRWVVLNVSDVRRDLAFRELLKKKVRDRGSVLKIDIEGGEVELLEELVKWNSINTPPIGLIVEFHDVCNKLDGIQKVVEELSPWYRVVHVHANNYGEVTGGVPEVLEVVFAEKQRVSNMKRSSIPLDGLDYPNNPLAEEIVLSWKVEGGF